MRNFGPDGDSLRCGNTRLRLLGVDAPELDHCPAWRTCEAGDGHAAKASLTAGLRYGRVRYQPVTRDRFGRQVAIVWAGRVNLSCWQLKAGQAVYKPHWDNGRLIVRACPLNRPATHTSTTVQPGGKMRTVLSANRGRSRIDPDR